MGAPACMVVDVHSWCVIGITFHCKVVQSTVLLLRSAERSEQRYFILSVTLRFLVCFALYIIDSSMFRQGLLTVPCDQAERAGTLQLFSE